MVVNELEDYIEMYCKKGYHDDPVSGCCGSGEHSDVDGMCGGCNEFTGWECPVCEADISDIVYS